MEGGYPFSCRGLGQASIVCDDNLCLYPRRFNRGVLRVRPGAEPVLLTSVERRNLDELELCSRHMVTTRQRNVR